MLYLLTAMRFQPPLQTYPFIEIGVGLNIFFTYEGRKILGGTPIMKGKKVNLTLS
jgi:hypothetical protein